MRKMYYSVNDTGNSQEGNPSAPIRSRTHSDFLFPSMRVSFTEKYIFSHSFTRLIFTLSFSSKVGRKAVIDELNDIERLIRTGLPRASSASGY